MRAFGENRVGHMRTQLNNAFSLWGSRSLTVDVSDPSAGYVRVNSVDLLPSTPGVDEDPYPWSGTYFRSVPVTLTARPAPGRSEERRVGKKWSERGRAGDRE